jgi:hypothetical protein
MPKTFVSLLVVLAALVAVPIINVLGLVDTGLSSNSVMLGFLGFGWAVLILLTVGELLLVRGRFMMAEPSRLPGAKAA